MRASELSAFAGSDYLRRVGDERVIGIVRPPLDGLIDALVALPEDAGPARRLACFESCVLALNKLGHDIDTIAREELCEQLYRLADIVGLDTSTDFLDEWRDF